MRRDGVYNQMEQFFTYRKIYFRSHRNFRIFYLNGKRPCFPLKNWNPPKAWLILYPQKGLIAKVEKPDLPLKSDVYVAWCLKTHLPQHLIKPLDWKKRPKGFFLLENHSRKRKRKTYIKEQGDRKEENRRKAMCDLLFFVLAGLRFLKKSKYI